MSSEARCPLTVCSRCFAQQVRSRDARFTQTRRTILPKATSVGRANVRRFGASGLVGTAPRAPHECHELLGK